MTPNGSPAPRWAKAMRKYLDGRAEAEAAWADDLDDRWDHAIAVPARRETAEFLDGIAPAARAAGGRVIAVVVVNGNAVDAPINDALVAACLGRFDVRRRLGGARSFLGAGDDFDLLLVDRASAGVELPRRGGVGLARKIGADIALALHAAGRVRSPWIHLSDGDAVQPPDRFTALPAADPAGTAVCAWTHPFVHEHAGDAALDRAISLYDLSLRYWRAGLAWAGSPWAFFTVGSAMTVHAGAYAAVRGFPRREAGEDFWMLAKLAKLGEIRDAPGGPVRLRGRTSDRVPFGTGAGVARILDETRRGRRFCLLPPEAFAVLRTWEASFGQPGATARRVAPAAPRAPAALEAAMRAVDPDGVLAGLSGVRRREWFDAFRTLRFLHTVRDHGFPPVPWREALDRARAMGLPVPGAPRLPAVTDAG